MKYFSWNAEKNDSLKRELVVSFEGVVFQFERGNVLDIVGHHNQERHPGQRIFVVNFDDYAYGVPFPVNAVEVFLKTIIPSRKATDTYLRRNAEDG